MSKSLNQEVPCLFHIHKMHLLPFLVLLETEMTYVPTFSFTAWTNEIATLSFPSSLKKKKPFRTEPPRIGHFRDYLPPGSLCFDFLFGWLSLFFIDVMTLIDLSSLLPTMFPRLYHTSESLQ